MVAGGKDKQVWRSGLKSFIISSMHPTPDYDFILNTEHSPKRPRLPSASSKQSRILIVAGGAVVLVIIAVIVVSLLGSAGSAGKAQLLKAAQQQTEIIRISKLGIERAKGSEAKNFAVTVNLSLQSDQTALLAALDDQGSKPNSKDLALGKNQKTDATLTNAEQSNKFDEVFIETLRAELLAYQKTLQSAFTDVSSQTIKTALNTQFQHAELLVSSK